MLCSNVCHLAMTFKQHLEENDRNERVEYTSTSTLPSSLNEYKLFICSHFPYVSRNVFELDGTSL